MVPLSMTVRLDTISIWQVFSIQHSAALSRHDRFVRIQRPPALSEAEKPGQGAIISNIRA